MSDDYAKVRLAAVQAASVWLDRDASVAKACRLIQEAADNGAQLIVFPEGFLPGFTDWYNWFMPRSPEAMRFYKALFKNAIEVPSPALDPVVAMARTTGTVVVMGINERVPGAMGSLYNSQVFITPQGIAGVHRKIVPTLMERLVHQGGDGTCLHTYDTPHGKLGGLICGENGNSLARFALLADGEQIHASSWPAFVFGNQNNHESIDIRARYHAFEGRVFVINACAVVDETCLGAMGLTPEQRATMANRGGHSSIVGPNGNFIAGPVDDAEQIVYADADMEKIIEGKHSFDTTGHSNRSDVFTFEVKARQPR